MPNNALPLSGMGYWIAVARTFVFYLFWFIPWHLIWCSLIVVLGWFIPLRWRIAIIVRGWSWPLVWGSWLITGIRYQVTGRENIPDKAILVANHQSTWETIFMLGLVSPQVPVLKRSLLNIPLFGWSLRTIYPIAINRDNPREAAKSVMEKGLRRIRQGLPYLLIYPEGTRKAPGQLGKFNRSAATLAKQAGIPVLPVSNNSGELWRLDSWVIFSGEVQVKIHAAIETDSRNTKEIMDQARTAIASHIQPQENTQESSHAA